MRLHRSTPSAMPASTRRCRSAGAFAQARPREDGLDARAIASASAVPSCPTPAMPVCGAASVSPASVPSVSAPPSLVVDDLLEGVKVHCADRVIGFDDQRVAYSVARDQLCRACVPPPLERHRRCRADCWYPNAEYRLRTVLFISARRSSR